MSDKILVVSQFFPPESMGGAHRWKKLAEELPDEFDCRVICPPPAFPFGNFERSWKPIERDEIDSVPVTRLWTYQPKSDSRATESNIGRILNYAIFTMFATLYVALNFWRYDTIVTLSAPHTTFLPGIMGKLLGLNWVVDVFDLWLDNALDLGYVAQGTLRHRFVAYLERMAITRSDHVLVITPTMAEHFQDSYGVDSNRFTVVPFGVDEGLFGEKPKVPEEKRVVYTGNLGDCHAHRPFFRAFADLDDSYQLLVVGTGKRQTELEQLCREEGISDRVSFAGVKPREEIPEILDESAVALVPLKKGYNLDYARPTKLLESMASGTPFVGSNVAEVELTAAESEAGLAVENDPETIGTAIESLVEDVDRRERHGWNGIEYIDAKHRWPELGDDVGDVFRSLS